MSTLSVATTAGCRVFLDAREDGVELPGHEVSAPTPARDGTCVAIVDRRAIWSRSPAGLWSRITTTGFHLESLVSVQTADCATSKIFAGAMDEPVMVRVSSNAAESGPAQRLDAFDRVPGRKEWFAGGPPLGVRSLAATADGEVVLAGVHVGGIPRSSDGGESWSPTIPVLYDVHEVRAHRTRPNFVAAAAAAGLLVSHDAGETWQLFSEGLAGTTCLALAVLEDEVLFSVQDGPFAERSQIWRWRIGSEHLEQVRDGLPEWLEGKVDTACMTAGNGQAALVDRGGNLWLSQAGSIDWQRIAHGVSALGIAML